MQIWEPQNLANQVNVTIFHKLKGWFSYSYLAIAGHHLNKLLWRPLVKDIGTIFNTKLLNVKASLSMVEEGDIRI